MNKRRIAPINILNKHNATLVGNGRAGGILYNGWIFTSVYGPMLHGRSMNGLINTLQELENFTHINNNNNNIEKNDDNMNEEEDGKTQDFDIVCINNMHLQLPEIIFGDNGLRLQNEENNLIIQFDILGILASWVSLATLETTEIIKIPAAKEWNTHLSNWSIKKEEYDWTFNNNYLGYFNYNNNEQENMNINEIENIDNIIKLGNLRLKEDQNQINNQTNNDNNINEPNSPVASYFPDIPRYYIGLMNTWENTLSSGINKNLLQRKDDILFYDDITFFQDELHDNGDVNISLKIRIMPSCWYILMRYFLRIDNVVIKISDIRYFHQFGTNEIHREITKLSREFDEALTNEFNRSPSKFTEPNEVISLLYPIPIDYPYAKINF